MDLPASQWINVTLCFGLNSGQSMRPTKCKIHKERRKQQIEMKKCSCWDLFHICHRDWSRAIGSTLPPSFGEVSKGGGAGAMAPSRSDQDRKHVEAEWLYSPTHPPRTNIGEGQVCTVKPGLCAVVVFDEQCNQIQNLMSDKQKFRKYKIRNFIVQFTVQLSCLEKCFTTLFLHKISQHI